MANKITILDAMRSQLRLVAAFKARDRRKRVLSSTIVTMMLIYLGYRWSAFFAFAAILAVEHARWHVDSNLPDRDREISDRRIIGTFLIDMLSVTIYCVPGIMFVKTGQLIGLVIGGLWLFSVTLHKVCGLALIAFWGWASLVPIMAATSFAMAVIIETATFSPIRQVDAVLIVLGLVIYLLNILDSIHQQRESRREFSAARARIDRRLCELEHRVRHDALTGLLNRPAFDAALSDVLGRRDSADGVSAVALIDLNRFKPINDTYGHEAGDAVLVEQARRLMTTVPDAAAARLGGDEFAVLLTGLESGEQAMEMAAWLHDSLNEAFDFKEHRLDLSASVGLALVDNTITSIEAVCARADKAMYDAKKNNADGPIAWHDIDESTQPRHRAL